MSYPDNNPKTAIGATKVPLHLVPPSATHYLAEAFENGAVKYGPYNWREHPISVSVYYAAMKRHTDAFWDGEDLAKDSGVHHIAHAMACLAMLLDASSIGKLNDDRPPKGAASTLQDEYADKKNITKKELPIGPTNTRLTERINEAASEVSRVFDEPRVPRFDNLNDHGL